MLFLWTVIKNLNNSPQSRLAIIISTVTRSESRCDSWCDWFKSRFKLTRWRVDVGLNWTQSNYPGPTHMKIEPQTSRLLFLMPCSNPIQLEVDIHKSEFELEWRLSISLLFSLHMHSDACSYRFIPTSVSQDRKMTWLYLKWDPVETLSWLGALFRSLSCLNSYSCDISPNVVFLTTPHIPIIFEASFLKHNIMLSSKAKENIDHLLASLIFDHLAVGSLLTFLWSN